MAQLGEVERSIANPLRIFGCAEVCLGGARRGRAWPGTARQGLAWLSKAKQTHGAFDESAEVCFGRSVSRLGIVQHSKHIPGEIPGKVYDR